MKICNLASGSRSNSTFVSCGDTSILIDDGLSVRELCKRAGERDIDVQKLSAIVVTHEHIDHIKGVFDLSKKFNIPVYIHGASLSRINSDLICNIAECSLDSDFEIGDISLSPFRLPHDSAYNLGFKIFDGKKTFCIATDLGYVSDNTVSKLCGSDMVVLESNHDLEMLKQGKYPYCLKQRILGKNGHLSNDDCGQTVVKLAMKGTEIVMLAHLSGQNNTPESAFDCSKNALEQNRLKEGKDITIEVASQTRPSRMIVL